MTNLWCQTIEEAVSRPNSDVFLNSSNMADDLIDSLINGEEKSFQTIWERYRLPVQKFIFDMCGNYELTEELTQETFVRFFKGIKNFRRETKLSTWIFGIAKNVVFEDFRRNKKHRQPNEFEEKQHLSQVSESASPENILLENEMLNSVYEALKKIDVEQRMSFSLRFFHGKSHREIAEITGFSIAKIKVDIYRTRVKLRKELSLFKENADEV